MKKILLSITALVIVIGVASSAVLPEEPNSDPVSFQFTSNGNVSMKLETDQQGSLDIQVFNEKGHKVHDKSISYDGTFIQPFNTSKLKEGNYTFRIKGKEIDLTRDVFVSKLYKEDIYATLDKTEDGVYRLRVLHNNVPVKIQIVDSKGHIRYNHIYVKNSNFTQDFKIINTNNADLEMIISGNRSTIKKKLL